jgi:pheromone shutdown protein TraB
MIQIHETDYTPYVDLIGVAHFTRRSLNDAYDAIASQKPRDVALELDWRRFTQLNTACLNCPNTQSCKGLCEFIGATDALGNTDANIWLIDMTEREMLHRMRWSVTPYERSRKRMPLRPYEDEDPVRLWERGEKARVINDAKRQIKTGRRYYPSLWRVLIDERNALMAARLAWISSTHLDAGTKPRILTFVGAAHVEGIRGLLQHPHQIRDHLRTYHLRFTNPTLIRRVAVQAQS